jgi:solute carrier family 25 carnitine/acylcarnitine transporter 20/29
MGGGAEERQTALVASVVQPIVAGAMGGFGSVLVGHPFETVKARLQTGVKPAWPGVRGAYTGIMSPLAGQVPFWASFYFGYSIGTALKWDDSQAAQVFAGAVAGAFSSLVLTPVDAVKIHAQVAQTGSTTALRQLLRTGGVAELFRALPPTMGRMVPASAVWFCT